MRSVWSLAVAGFLAIGATLVSATVQAAAPSGSSAAAPVAASPASSAPTDSAAAAHPPSVVRLAQTNDAYRPPDGYTGYDSGANDTYRSDDRSSERYDGGSNDAYRPPSSSNDVYRPPSNAGYGAGSAYNSGPPPARYDDRYPDDRGGDAYQGRSAPPSGRYGEPYAPPPADSAARYDRNEGYPEPRPPEAYDDRRYYTKNEIIAAGHGFFGSISQGLASVIEHAFKKAGRPNGYILGEDAGGAFVAGLRYGEGRLYTKDAGTHKVYWQGPSVGYDFGGAGSKTMILVYNLRDPSDVYHRFGGVEGTAYLVGGVSIQFQKHGDVVMAPIRAGIGLRLGANVGYLKYTRRPTWNPF